MKKLNDLQNLFNKIEKDLMVRLKGLDILGNYTNVLKEIVSLDYNIFDMVYYQDTENYQEYMIDESVEYFQSQILESYYQLNKYFK